MKRIAIIALGLSISFACSSKKAPVEETGSGSAVGSSDSGSGSGSGSGYQMPGVIDAPPAPTAPGEKRIALGQLLEIVELTARSTGEARQFEVRGARGGYTLTVVGGAKDPTLTEFPLSTPDHKNMNSTIATIEYPAGTLQLSATSFDEIAKPGQLPPERMKATFDLAQKGAVGELKVDKSTDETIAGQPGRIVELSGEVGNMKKKVAGKLWFIYLGKANVYLQLQVVAPPGDALIARAEDAVKSLAIAP